MSEVTLTKENFESEVLNAQGKVLVDFWAPWCGPCKMIAPVVEEVANEFSDKIKVCKVNVDTEVELAIGYKVISVPTLMVFENGQIVNQTAGYHNKEQLLEFLNL